MVNMGHACARIVALRPAQVLSDPRRSLLKELRK